MVAKKGIKYFLTKCVCPTLKMCNESTLIFKDTTENSVFNHFRSNFSGVVKSRAPFIKFILLKVLRCTVLCGYTMNTVSVYLLVHARRIRHEFRNDCRLTLLQHLQLG